MRRMTDVGTWLLTQLARGPYTDAIAGDLMEGVRRGHSAGWYWRQVLWAIAVAWAEKMRERRGRILFAAAWGMFWPARGLMGHAILVWWLRGTIDLSYGVRQWMTLGLEFLTSMTYLWVGLLVYLALDRERWHSVPLRRFVRSWAACPGVFAGGKVTLLLGVLLLVRAPGAEGLALGSYFQGLMLLGDPVMAAVSLLVAIGIMLPGSENRLNQAMAS